MPKSLLGQSPCLQDTLRKDLTQVPFLFFSMGTAVRMVAITKSFPGTLANDRVDFDVEEGEVHSLLGENGAGKTVLMSILYGLYKPDKGQIFIKEKEVKIDSPAKAI